MERKERLDTLGMSWDPHSTDWDAMFDLLSASPKLLECWPSEAPRGKGKGKGKGREEKERGKGWGRGAAKTKEGKVVRFVPNRVTSPRMTRIYSTQEPSNLIKRHWLKVLSTFWR